MPRPSTRAAPTAPEGPVDGAEDDDKRAAPAPPATTTAPAKRARGSKRDPWTDEELLMSAKSKLIDIDLARYFARPEAWDVLSPEEQQQLRDLLPPHAPYDAAGRPTFEFLRYDENWRTGLRLFQEDLAGGRYEKEWLAAAELAMKERAAGKFDAYKEEQFEQHWGQKSHVDPAARAREMAKVPLERLVADGEFRVGDVWTYVKPLGRGKARFLLEKDVTVVAVAEKTLTVLIPLGQRRRIAPQSQNTTHPPATSARQPDNAPESRPSHVEESGEEGTEPQPSGPSQKLPLGSAKAPQPTTPPQDRPISLDSSPLSEAISLPSPGGSHLPSLPDMSRDTTESGASNDPMTVDTSAKTRSPPPQPKAGSTSEEKMAVDRRSDGGDISSASRNDIESTEPMFVAEPAMATRASTKTRPATSTTAEPDTEPGGSTDDPDKDDAAAMEYVVTALPMLERAIIEVDGRIANWDGRGGNQWRTFRCIRDGQDRGTIWDMKERYAERKGLLSTMG